MQPLVYWGWGSWPTPPLTPGSWTHSPVRPLHMYMYNVQCTYTVCICVYVWTCGYYMYSVHVCHKYTRTGSLLQLYVHVLRCVHVAHLVYTHAHILHVCTSTLGSYTCIYTFVHVQCTCGKAISQFQYVSLLQCTCTCIYTLYMYV